MKTAYVTGATGCVGRNLIDSLLENNWQIVVLHRSSSDLSRLDGLKLRFQVVDLHDLASVRKAIPEGIDAIFHVAGNTSHWAREQEEQWRDNVLATRHLVDVALEKKVKRFIFTSTGATRPYQDTDTQSSENIKVPYIRTKRQSELEVEAGVARGLDAVILQPIIVVGAYDYNSYSQIFQYIKTAMIRLCFDSKICFCHAKDVADAHVRAYELGRRGELYVLGGPYLPWKDLFSEIALYVAPGVKIFATPYWMLRTRAFFEEIFAVLTGREPLVTKELIRLVCGDSDVSEADAKKARDELAYSSRPLKEMVKDCYQWLKAESRI